MCVQMVMMMCRMTCLWFLKLIVPPLLGKSLGILDAIGVEDSIKVHINQIVVVLHARTHSAFLSIH